MRWSWAVICVAGTSLGGLGGGCYPSAAVPPFPDARHPARPAPPSTDTPLPTPVPDPAFSNISLRKAWQPAEKPRAWKSIVLHHTATERGSVESIHEAHLAKEWLGIGYHFVIGNGNGMPDGKIEPTFRWTRQIHGAHAGVKDYNELGIGICLVGNFEEHPPSARQLASLKTLLASLTGEYRIPAKQVVPHRDVKATACPGKFFPLDDVTLALGPVDGRAHDARFARIATAPSAHGQDAPGGSRIPEFPGPGERTGGLRLPLAVAAQGERRSR